MASDTILLALFNIKTVVYILCFAIFLCCVVVVVVVDVEIKTYTLIICNMVHFEITINLKNNGLEEKHAPPTRHPSREKTRLTY